MPAVRPSETPEGGLWLANFGAADLTIPILLLDSLRIVSDGGVRASLVALLTEVVKDCEPPVALFPIREVPEETPYYKLTHPDYLGSASLPGSEAMIANVIRDIVRPRKTKDRVIEWPSLDALRGKRCRTLLLIDDYSGSGTRAIKFATA